MSGIVRSIQKAFCSPPLEAPHCLCIPGYWWFQPQCRMQQEHKTDYLLLLWLSSPALQSEEAMSPRMNISPLKFLSHAPQPRAFSILSESFNVFFLRWLDVKMCFPLLLLHYCAFFPSTPLFSNCFNMFENKQCMRVQLALSTDIRKFRLELHCWCHAVQLLGGNRPG